MAQSTAEKQILEKLDKVEKTMNQILEHLEDAKLSNEEKQLLDGSFEREKGHKMISGKELSRKLKL